MSPYVRCRNYIARSSTPTIGRIGIESLARALFVDAFLFVPATFNGLSPFTTGASAGGRGGQQGLRRMSRRNLSEVFGDRHGAQQRPDRERSISGELRSRGVFGSCVRRRLSRGAGPGGIPVGIYTWGRGSGRADARVVHRIRRR